MGRRGSIVVLAVVLSVLAAAAVGAVNLSPSVKDDPLVRMPGTQPDQGVNLEGPNRCLNCHGGYNEAVEPGFNWKGSMMAQASRDPIFWACLTVAGQDSHYAVGTPNAVDICERCHFPAGWLGGRSDPPNASAMTGDDYDGLSCDFCHRMWDPFFETTFDGTREGNDWAGYWDESNLSSTPSQPAAADTYAEDTALAQAISLFNGTPFFASNLPHSASYDENGSGQYFVSTSSQKRASFADAAARHQMLYSRYHKSKYFCATCHDVSNPALANLDFIGTPPGDGTTVLTTESDSAYSYFHVERTWSEFMSSAYGQMGGAATNPEFQAQGAPDITRAAKCQDCHMRDVTGRGCNKNGVPVRPDESVEHPQSGLPLHDLTGGNAWVSYILASTDPNGPVYDPVNAQLLDQGPAVLTLDLNAGQTPKVNGAALLAGSDRAKQQLLLAATIKNVSYDGSTLSFQVQNNTAHKLISGFPEGRRMFVNVKAYAGGSLIHEVNPYDYTAGTLKGTHYPSAPALGPNESYVDELVYEVHPSSALTGEDETFHFVLATGRYKDNRIPPKGFDVAEAARRIAEPVWHGVSDQGYFTASEYAGGYDETSLDLAGGDYIEITLYYQGTSKEYVAFLRDEINGTATTLPASAYIVQTDPFFAQLAAWGDTIWQLWEHNHAMGVAGIVPFQMAQATVGTPTGCTPPDPPANLSAAAGNQLVDLAWDPVPGAAGYRVYYDQAGKSQLVADVGGATSYTDTALTNGLEYCYKVTAYTDCESGFSSIACATPQNQGQTTDPAGVEQMEAGYWSGKGKSQTWVDASAGPIPAGETVVIRARVVDGVTGLPISNATVEVTVGGPESTVLNSNPSGADGWAEASWNTSAPNRKGQGGTTPGSYTATTTNVTASGYHWDMVTTSTTFSIQ